MSAEQSVWRRITLMVCRLWSYSLWLCVPIVLLLSLWLGHSAWRFTQHELVVSTAENRALTSVMSYQAARWREQIINRWWPRAVPSSHSVHALQIFVAQKQWRKLNRDLPQSGKDSVPAHLSGEGLSRNTELLAASLRFHGNAPLHWRGDKRSLHIKLEKNQQFLGVNEFDLLVPATLAVVEQQLAYRLAHALQLLQPRAELIWLSINGEPAGLYQMQAPISEQTLLNLGQMPGDIYAGEVAGSDAYSGVDNHLFSNAGLWHKISAQADYPKESVLPLTLLIDLLQQRTRNFPVLRQLLDYESFARLHLFNELSGRRNIDDFHNWRLYFDPARGRFFPMIWDVEAWPELESTFDRRKAVQGEAPANNAPAYSHALDELLLADPMFLAEVSRQYQMLQSSGALLAFIAEGKQLLSELTAFIAADPNRSLDLHYFSVADFVAAGAALMRRIETSLALSVRALSSTLTKAQSESIAAPTVLESSTPAQPALRWRGQMRIDGIQHFHQPVQIEAGTRLLLGPQALLVFYAPLRIEGTARQPVVITALDPMQPFSAVVLTGAGANGSRLQHCAFSRGSAYKDALHNFTAMFSVHEVADVVIERCQFTANSKADDLVHAVYSSLHIVHSEFSHSTGDGLDLELSNAFVEHSVFKNNAKEGLDTMASTVVVRASRFSGNQDKALSIGQRSLVRLENSVLNDNRIALLIKDTSALRVSNSTLRNNQELARLQRDNAHYAEGGTAFIYHSQLFGLAADDAVPIKLKANSTLAVHDSYLTPVLLQGARSKGFSIDPHSDAAQERRSRTKLVLSAADQSLFQAMDRTVPPVFFMDSRGAQADGDD